MISFVVIGRNEGWKLSKCLKSIKESIGLNQITDSEIIYVDSNSSDESREIAQKHEGVKVLNLIGDFNAAIARNVGASNSKGETIFFIDGDMEIEKSFLSRVYSQKDGLVENFISGNWMNYFYDKDDNFLNKEKFLNLEQDKRESTTGGLFLIKREIWEKVSGMREIFKKSQDIDLGLRLSENNIYLLRKKEIAANHHTIAYRNKNRIWKELLNGKHLYGRSLLYRKHIFNKNMYSRLVRNDYSLIILILCLGLTIFIENLFCLIPYVLTILFRSKLKLNIFLYFILRDLIVLFGIFFFLPKRNFDVRVERVN